MKNCTPLIRSSFNKGPTHLLHFVSCLVLVLALSSPAIAAEPVELTGRVAMRSVDCFDEDLHDHEPEYFLVDEETDNKVRLLSDSDLLKKLEPFQRVQITGTRSGETANGSERGSELSSFSTLSLSSHDAIEVESVEVLAEPKAFGAQSLERANAAPELRMLTCLLVFASSLDYDCAVEEANATGLLFDNPTNANEGLQAITKGHFGLQLGNGSGEPAIVHLELDVSSVGKDSDDMEVLMMAALADAGYNRYDYDRVMLFPPAGIKNFWAWGYYGSSSTIYKGMVTAYGPDYGNRRMNGFLHELGHNFGFAHSSKGNDEYGDRTCVMGLSKDATKTETYNGPKLLETDWLDVFPGSTEAPTTDITLDLYPLSSDPNTVSEVIAVSIPGTDYYVSYHVDDRPYGFLSQAGDRDRLFVYTRASGLRKKSFQVANLEPGESYSGPGEITFDRYGPDNAYARISIDLDDGNAKPVPIAQSLNTNTNTSLALTLAGTDADDDTLSFSIVEAPAHGTLTGTAPHLTYTPANDFTGDDSFVFEVSDGAISAFGAVDIAVYTNTVAPEVLAGENQVVSLSDGTAWTPVQMTTTGWYDASDDTTIVSSGGAISQWNDKSGNSLHLAQASSSKQPTLEASVINGSSAVNFDGSNDELVTSINPFGSTVNDAFVIAVHHIDQAGNKGTIFTLTGSDAASSRWQSHAPFGTTVYLDCGGTGGGSRVNANYGVNTGDSVMVGFYCSTTDSVQQIYKNGALWVGDSTGHSVSTVGNIFVGSGAGSSYQDTSIGEFIIINGTVSLDERQNIEGYLAHKWGLQNDLPMDHPYKSVAPGGAVALVALGGIVSDADGPAGGEVISTWTKVSGPGDVLFGNESSTDTTAIFTEAGTYVLRLTADDGLFQTFDEMTVIVRADTDNDSIDDSWETAYFDDTESIDGSADSDGDGVKDFFEYLYGSDPTDSASVGFRLQTESSASAFVIDWDVSEGFELGTDYAVEYTSDLSDPGSWVTLPLEAYTLQPSTSNGMTNMMVEITQEFDTALFIRLVQP